MSDTVIVSLISSISTLITAGVTGWYAYKKYRKTFKQQVGKLQAELDALQLANATTKIATREKSADFFERSYKLVMEETEGVLEELMQLKLRSITLQDQIESQKLIHARQLAQIETATQENNQLRENNASLQNKVESLKGKIESLNVMHQTAIRAAQDRIEELEREVEKYAG